MKAFSLDVESGEFLSVLGPSGAGKTTLLRCIAGLEVPESGEIRIENKVVFSRKEKSFTPLEKRGVGMVFQSYAVWPHMTVFDNVAFPLKIKRASTAELKERVLSAGQQQRVALARALVSEPRILLLDEPLSNLDAKLRDYMRVELKELQRLIGVTAVYVTHDHTEAFALSPRIIVMQAGRVLASGSPRELFENRRSRFVAEFLGHGNILQARLLERRKKGLAFVDTRIGQLSLRIPSDLGVNQEFHVCLRGGLAAAPDAEPTINVGVNLCDVENPQVLFQLNSDTGAVGCRICRAPASHLHY